MRLNNYCLNIIMETMFMNTENSKTNQPHKFVVNLSQRLDVKITYKKKKKKKKKKYI